MNPQFPVYIVSKARAESRLTSRALEAMAVPYRIVVEPQEVDAYAAGIDRSKILTLPFSNLGQGSIPARNWIWEHALSEGHKRHWILDDNIRSFRRVHQNKITECRSGVCFRAIEDFVLRYSNVPLAGMHYDKFVVATKKTAPFTLNTRIYSCILIQNDLPFRWRGRYNEDTDLSLRVLKAGYCTILMKAFVCGKETTMTMKGGNTDELYRQDSKFDGRYEMAKSLQLQHPDITKVVFKWGRWQHSVNYKPFRKNKLIRAANVEVPAGVNNYGMKLAKRNAGAAA